MTTLNLIFSITLAFFSILAIFCLWYAVFCGLKLQFTDKNIKWKLWQSTDDLKGYIKEESKSERINKYKKRIIKYKKFTFIFLGIALLNLLLLLIINLLNSSFNV